MVIARSAPSLKGWGVFRRKEIHFDEFIAIPRRAREQRIIDFAGDHEDMERNLRYFKVALYENKEFLLQLKALKAKNAKSAKEGLLRNFRRAKNFRRIGIPVAPIQG